MIAPAIEGMTFNTGTRGPVVIIVGKSDWRWVIHGVRHLVENVECSFDMMLGELDAFKVIGDTYNLPMRFPMQRIRVDANIFLYIGDYDYLCDDARVAEFASEKSRSTRLSPRGHMRADEPKWSDHKYKKIY